MAEDFKLNQRVWHFNASDGSYVLATIKEYAKTGDEHRFVLQLDETKATVSLSARTGSQLPLPLNPDDVIGCDNLCDIFSLSEPEILRSLKVRYAKDVVYTNSGLVLVALNPFKHIPQLYADETREFYRSNYGIVPPHLFDIAEAAYRDMMQMHRNQSIIINGESGAGKTVSAKHVMKYYTAVGDSSATASASTGTSASVDEKILSTSAIMEALGNAKTERNDNSSRFGKYIKLQFGANGHICGASMETYLLEKSRVCFHNANERNYHIFYQMIAGLDAPTKAELRLTKVGDFAYLRPELTHTPFDDAAEFRDTCKSLDALSVDSAIRRKFFRALAGILHLGNVVIEGSKDESRVARSDSLIVSCELLGFSVESFVQAIELRKVKTPEGIVTAKNSAEKAIEIRDSTAKFIYMQIFSWLVAYINGYCKSEDFVNFIGILDIYGFEFFKVNGLEQLCINFANEKLQQEYNKHVFKVEQKIYADEGVPLDFIKFNDNQPCIDMIEGRGGLIDQLDEQSKVAIGSDQKFRDGLFASSVTKANAHLKQPKMGQNAFIVKHFAADVTYESAGLLDKNRDSLPEEIKAVLLSSTESFVKSIIPASIMEPSKISVTSAFRNSLAHLCEMLRATNPYYVRCIKPNSLLKNLFDEKYTLSQLIACGILETVKMATAGFPSRKPHAQFLERYGLIAPKVSDEMAHIRAVLARANFVENVDFAMGKTLVFMRVGVLAGLEGVRESVLIGSVRQVIGRFLAKIQRQRVKELLVANRSLQGIFRNASIRRDIVCRRHASTVLQQILKRNSVRLLMRPVIVTQRSFRMRQKAAVVNLFGFLIMIQTNIRHAFFMHRLQLEIATRRIQCNFRSSQIRSSLYAHLHSVYSHILQMHIRAALQWISFHDPITISKLKREIAAKKRQIEEEKRLQQEMLELQRKQQEYLEEQARLEAERQKNAAVSKVKHEMQSIDDEIRAIETDMAVLMDVGDMAAFDSEEGQQIALKKPEFFRPSVASIVFPLSFILIDCLIIFITNKY